jgi:prevent-host-death family protein
MVNNGDIQMHERQTMSVDDLQERAAETIREVACQRDPLFIEENGKPVAIVQGYDSYKEASETLALLEIILLGKHEIEQGQVMTIDEAVERIRARHSRG